MRMFSRLIKWIQARPRRRDAVAVVVIVAATAAFTCRSPARCESAPFGARRGPLRIGVLEGGTLQALDSQELKCEVRVGYQGAKILKIIDEGYQITESDVRAHKVLVELDSSELQKQL